MKQGQRAEFAVTRHGVSIKLDDTMQALLGQLVHPDVHRHIRALKAGRLTLHFGPGGASVEFYVPMNRRRLEWG